MTISQIKSVVNNQIIRKHKKLSIKRQQKQTNQT